MQFKQTITKRLTLLSIVPIGFDATKIWRVKRVIDFMNQTYLNCFFTLLHLLRIHLFRFIMLLMVPLVGILSPSNVISTSDLDPVGNIHTQYPGNHHKIRKKFMWGAKQSLKYNCRSNAIPWDANIHQHMTLTYRTYFLSLLSFSLCVLFCWCMQFLHFPSFRKIDNYNVRYYLQRKKFKYNTY